MIQKMKMERKIKKLKFQRKNNRNNKNLYESKIDDFIDDINFEKNKTRKISV